MENFIYTHSAAAMSYLLWQPDDRTPDEKLPLLVFLHGAGERGSDPYKMCVHCVPKIFMGAHPYRCVMTAPQCPDGMTWYPLLPALKDFIAMCVESYGCDAARVSLTGISMGGYGTWELAMAYPELFSAIAPICGGGMAWRAGLLKDIPVRAYHGDCDTAVLPERSYEMVDAVNRSGGHAELTVFHNVGHDSWVKAYGETDLIAWLIAQKRA
ncbi:MAG: hypothetical protein ACOXZM_01355 [Eubacteriales bacterium]|jgi:predicted peptidase